ncbi:chaperonin 10-like protein [Podospora fimiseda]|uniref:Chaperonin 10-like protein n=1 Tax=Podospora fimiseda TaxID=252190 RepID=A0AAN7GS96_9PEZI|nr:chaperonin 10-like protein [Podospora fimiseda]
MTSIPETYRAIRRTGPLPTESTPQTFTITTERTFPNGKLSPSQVLIKIIAVSLNFRDALMLHGQYPPGNNPDSIPASDCVAVVSAIGSSVTKFKVGDRVTPTFDPDDIHGENPINPQAGLGAYIDGVLREYAIFEEEALVSVPAYLSWEEAATLGCAAITAWNALSFPSLLSSPDDHKYVLIQGTGGVSLFSLLFCLFIRNITPIITSSSDNKLSTLRKKLSHHPSSNKLLSYNYKTFPDQASQIKLLTKGKGVSIIINNSGPASIPADIECLSGRNGQISLVGFLAGWKTDWNGDVIMGLLMKVGRIQGVAVGTKDDLEGIMGFLEKEKVGLGSLVDEKIFKGLEGSREAVEYLWRGGHLGKVVVRVADDV